MGNTCRRKGTISTWRRRELFVGRSEENDKKQMIYKVELRRRTVNQMQKSYDYYENKSKGLGERFVADIEGYFEKITHNPKHFQVKRLEI